MKPPTYRDHLIAVHRLHLDSIEADGDGPLDSVAYRNKINRARWQARWSASPPEPGPTGKPDHKTGGGGLNVGEVARIDLETGEVTEFRPQEITAHGLFHIPESIGEVASIVGHAMGLAYASHWGTAALVWAWTEDGQGRRSDLCRKGQKLTMAEFAALGIRGLSKPHTVAKYRAAWQWAIDEGHAQLGEGACGPRDCPRAAAVLTGWQRLRDYSLSCARSCASDHASYSGCRVSITRPSASVRLVGA